MRSFPVRSGETSPSRAVRRSAPLVRRHWRVPPHERRTVGGEFAGSPGQELHGLERDLPGLSSLHTGPAFPRWGPPPRAPTPERGRGPLRLSFRTSRLARYARARAAGRAPLAEWAAPRIPTAAVPDSFRGHGSASSATSAPSPRCREGRRRRLARTRREPPESASSPPRRRSDRNPGGIPPPPPFPPPPRESGEPPRRPPRAGASHFEFGRPRRAARVGSSEPHASARTPGSLSLSSLPRRRRGASGASGTWYRTSASGGEAAEDAGATRGGLARRGALAGEGRTARRSAAPPRLCSEGQRRPPPRRRHRDTAQS